MRSVELNDRRSREILADVVRTYIETGEPVSSRSISRRHHEALSPATIRNVMADLEEAGYLYQPHTSAGRVPTPEGYRSFVQSIVGQGQMESQDQEWIRRELGSANTAEELMERASHVLAAVSRGLGIVVAPPLARIVLEHIRFLLLPDGRIVVFLVSTGGLMRDKAVQPERTYSQADLDNTAEYLNQHYGGCTLEDIRGDLRELLARDHERYNRLVETALALCDPKLLGEDTTRQVYLEGAAQIATAAEFTDQAQLRELLDTIEHRKRLIELLTGCIEAPEPVQVQIGVKEINIAGEHLSLISAPYGPHDQAQGSVGVLGPMRMHYERAITVVAHVARLFSDEERKAN